MLGRRSGVLPHLPCLDELSGIVGQAVKLLPHFLFLWVLSHLLSLRRVSKHHDAGQNEREDDQKTNYDGDDLRNADASIFFIFLRR